MSCLRIDFFSCCLSVIFYVAYFCEGEKEKSQSYNVSHSSMCKKLLVINRLKTIKYKSHAFKKRNPIVCLNGSERRRGKDPTGYIWSKAALFPEAESSPRLWQRPLIYKCAIIVSFGAARLPRWPSDLRYLLTVPRWLWTAQTPRGCPVSKQQTESVDGPPPTVLQCVILKGSPGVNRLRRKKHWKQTTSKKANLSHWGAIRKTNLPQQKLWPA